MKILIMFRDGIRILDLKLSGLLLGFKVVSGRGVAVVGEVGAGRSRLRNEDWGETTMDGMGRNGRETGKQEGNTKETGRNGTKRGRTERNEAGRNEMRQNGAERD